MKVGEYYIDHSYVAHRHNGKKFLLRVEQLVSYDSPATFLCKDINSVPARSMLTRVETDTDLELVRVITIDNITIILRG